MSLHQIARQIELAASGVDRQRAQQPGDGIGNPGVPREIAGAEVAAVSKNARR